jgi:DNA-binding MarR family transcriptional regulator
VTLRSRASSATGLRLLSHIVDVFARDLKDAETKVWIALFRDARGDSLARTGQTDLAKRCGVTVRTVQTAIARLKDKGFLEVVLLGRINAGPSIYRVKVPD